MHVMRQSEIELNQVYEDERSLLYMDEERPGKREKIEDCSQFRLKSIKFKTHMISAAKKQRRDEES